MLEDQRVSVCAGGAQARCSVLVWLARRAAAARVEDAGLVEMLSDVILRPREGRWKGSALRARGARPLGGERPCQKKVLGDCGHSRFQGLWPEGGGLARPGPGSRGNHAGTKAPLRFRHVAKPPRGRTRPERGQASQRGRDASV